jgi:hypothetical protein
MNINDLNTEIAVATLYVATPLYVATNAKCRNADAICRNQRYMSQSPTAKCRNVAAICRTKIDCVKLCTRHFLFTCVFIGNSHNKSCVLYKII